MCMWVMAEMKPVLQLSYMNLPPDGTLAPQTLSTQSGLTHLLLSVIHFVNNAAGAQHIVNTHLYECKTLSAYSPTSRQVMCHHH